MGGWKVALAVSFQKLGITLVAGAVLVATAALVPAMAAVAEAAVSWESRFWVILRQLDSNIRSFSSIAQ